MTGLARLLCFSWRIDGIELRTFCRTFGVSLRQFADTLERAISPGDVISFSVGRRRSNLEESRVFARAPPRRFLILSELRPGKRDFAAREISAHEILRCSPNAATVV